MKQNIVVAIIGAIAVTASAMALAQGTGPGMPMHPKGSEMGGKMGKSGSAAPAADAHAQQAAQGDTGPSSTAYRAVNDKMHKDMAITFSGDADADFVRGMIPHHQGAIDMAKVVLAHGKDSQIRKLAEDVIKAQEGEIAMMNDWLKKNVK